MDACKKVKSFFDIYNGFEAIVIEHTVFMNSPKTAADLALVQGAILGSAGQSGTTMIGRVSPITWQNYMGNKKISKDEQLFIRSQNPGKSVSWYKSYERQIRKERTIKLIEINYDKIINDNDKLLKDYGIEKKDRTGTGTKSIFGYTIRHNMKDGFPLLTTKKMYTKGIITELLWFLRGDTNIKFLVDNDCHIWDGDAYKNWKSNGRDFWEEQVDGMFTSELGEESVDKISKEWFINKIKTDDEFAKKWGDLGKIYGHGWRNWNGKSEDELYDDYLKKVKK